MRRREPEPSPRRPPSRHSPRLLPSIVLLTAACGGGTAGTLAAVSGSAPAVERSGEDRAAPVAWQLDGAPLLRAETSWRALDADCRTACGLAIDAVSPLRGGDLLVHGDAFHAGRRRGPRARAFDLAGAALAPGGWRWGLRARLAPDGTARWVRLFPSIPSSSLAGVARANGDGAWAWGVLAASGLPGATVRLGPSRTLEAGADETVAWLARYDLDDARVTADVRVDVDAPWDVAVTGAVPSPGGRGITAVAMVGCGELGPCTGALPRFHASGRGATGAADEAWREDADAGGSGVTGIPRYTPVASWLLSFDERGRLVDRAERVGPGYAQLVCTEHECLLVTTHETVGSRDTHLEVRRVGEGLELAATPSFASTGSRAVVSARGDGTHVWVVASHSGFGPVTDHVGSVLLVFEEGAHEPRPTALADSIQVRVVGARFGRPVLSVGSYVHGDTVGLVELDPASGTAHALARIPLAGWFLRALVVEDDDVVWAVSAASGGAPAEGRTPGLEEESRVHRGTLPARAPGQSAHRGL